MLQLADSRGLWQQIMLEEDDELAGIKDSDEYRAVLDKVKRRYPQHAKDAGTAYFYRPQGLPLTVAGLCWSGYPAMAQKAVTAPIWPNC